MDKPLVVDGVGPMFKVLHLIVQMVRHDMQVERAGGMIERATPQTAAPYRYNPAEW